MEAHLRECIQGALDTFMHRNATFLAERLHASFPSEPNVLLLATCYFRSQQHHRVYSVLKGTSSPPCRYLFAVACVELLKLQDAELALRPSADGEVPGGTAGHFLLGSICLKGNRRPEAVTHFSNALLSDPLCWCAFEELCNLGQEQQAAALLDEADPYALYPTRAEVAAATGEDVDFVTPAGQPAHGSHVATTPGAHMSLASPRVTTVHGVAQPQVHGDTVMASDAEQVTPMEAFMTPPPGSDVASRVAPAVVKHLGTVGASTAPGSGFTTAQRDKRGATSHLGANRRKLVDEGKLRKVSGRLFSDLPAHTLRRSSRLSGVPPALHEATPSVYGVNDMQQTTPLRGNATAVPGRAEQWQWWPSHGMGKTAEGAEEALQLFRTLGKGFRLLSVYRCQESIAAFEQLPPAQYRTAWVLCCIGRAHVESADYLAAERAYVTARSVCPHHLAGLEYYSTALWHLKKDAALAYLAHEAMSLDRFSPAAWCIVGNCFSLQREHEAALRAFGRAQAVDVECTYAYTLSGHEYFAAEDWEQAKRNYRIANALDARHYNAWYGLGAVFMKTEKFDMAEYHFRRALSINPRSSVLHCCLGQALHALGKHDDALQALHVAVQCDGRNPLARYERANVLVSLGALQEALAELTALKDVAPREASVYSLMSKVYKKLNQPHMASLFAGTGADLGGAKETAAKEDGEEEHVAEA